MYLATCDLIGVSDLMFGKKVDEPKRDEETHDQHDLRTWQQKVGVADDGQCYLQPFALKNALESAAKWLAMKIEGQGAKTFTKRFLSGVLIVDNLLLTADGKKPTRIDDVDPRRLFVPSDGVRGSAKRVTRTFPTLYKWATKAAITVFDEMITEKVMLKHLQAAGKFIGFGAMRVEKGGINGRFDVQNLKWHETE